MLWHNILCPTDFTGLSEAAVRYAAQLARASQARLIILHAVETLGPENVTFGEAVTQRQPEAYRKRLWDELHRNVAVDARITQEFVMSDETPASAIVDAANHYGCDLIVMGTHNRQGLRLWLSGSVAYQVIRRASCPVLVVKEPELNRKLTGSEGTALHPHVLLEKQR